MSKYKYYFKKPRSEIVKDIFGWLMVTGLVCIAASSPHFSINLWKGIRRFRKSEKRKVYDAFWNLRKGGYINIEKKNHQIYISLTEKGRSKAGWMQIDNLKIKKPKKWDGKWRIVMFDIAQLKRVYREAFRGKLKELGFCPFQKSVWIHPFNCHDEINLLKSFFGLTDKEVRLIITEDIGRDDYFKKIFKID